MRPLGLHTKLRQDSAIDARDVLLVIVGLKLAVLIADPQLRLFLGDSASYLHAAIVDGPPADRSFLYALIVRALALGEGSAMSLMLFATLGGIGASMMVFALASRLLLAPVWLAALLAIALALDPAWLYYERTLMAESSAGVAALAALAAMLAFVERGHRLWLLVALVAGVIAIALRTAFLPLIAGIAVLGPALRLIATWRRSDRRARGLALATLIAAPVVFATLLAAHGRWHESALRAAASMNGRADAWTVDIDELRGGGRFLLVLMLPSVRPEHFAGLGLPDDFLSTLKLPLNDRRLREANLWTEDGLFAALSRHSAEPEALARKIALRAFRDDRLGLVTHGFRTWADLFDPANARHRIADDLGVRTPDAASLAWFAAHLDVAVSGQSPDSSLTARWFDASQRWMQALFLALPLTALALAWRALMRRQPTGVFIAFAALGFWLALVLFSPVATFRYLHFAPALLALVVAALAAPGVARATVEPHP